jgi:hypothetical protein
MDSKTVRMHSHLHKEWTMAHLATAARPGPRARAAALAGLVCVALALASAAEPVRAADPAAKADADTTVTIRALPPLVKVDIAANDDAGQPTGTKKSSRIRIDSDDDFDAAIEKMPWLIGLIFLVVASVFLTPIVLLVGIIWYKLRKARLQNEAMLALAEKGVVPPAQAAEALASGAPPASVAPQIYQQSAEIRKRAVWSDLRKGVILTTVGLAFSFYELTSGGGPSWLGLVLLFVGAGYVALWWLEGRHLQQAKPGGNDVGRSGVSGS